MFSILESQQLLTGFRIWYNSITVYQGTTKNISQELSLLGVFLHCVKLTLLLKNRSCYKFAVRSTEKHHLINLFFFFQILAWNVVCFPKKGVWKRLMTFWSDKKWEKSLIQSESSCSHQHYYTVFHCVKEKMRKCPPKCSPGCPLTPPRTGRCSIDGFLV